MEHVDFYPGLHRLRCLGLSCFPLVNTISLLLLLQIQENWKFHKPRVATYWLVKLDSVKRRKVEFVHLGHLHSWLIASVNHVCTGKYFLCITKQ